MRLSLPTKLVVPSVALVAMAGCGSAAGEPAGLETADASTLATPAPTAATASTAATTAPPSTALPPGLVFEDVPEASGKAAAALEAYLGLETAIWRSFLDAKLSPDLATYATAPVVADWEASVKYQRDHDMLGGGRIVITPKIERANDYLVLIGGCADMSELTTSSTARKRRPKRYWRAQPG